MKITQAYLEGKKNIVWTLVHKSTNVPVEVNEKVTSGTDTYQVLSGYPPAHAGSSGRIYVQGSDMKREFFPHVFGLVWIREEFEAE